VPLASYAVSMRRFTWAAENGLSFAGTYPRYASNAERVALAALDVMTDAVRGTIARHPQLLH
jgi:hypothetical protein